MIIIIMFDDLDLLIINDGLEMIICYITNLWMFRVKMFFCVYLLTVEVLRF